MKTALPETQRAKKEGLPKSPKKEKPQFHHSLDRIGELQGAVGNRTVQQFFKAGKLQAMLRVGKPNDSYEREADRMADRVMRMPEPGVQKKCAPCAEGGPLCAKCAEEEKKKIRRKPDSSAGGLSVPGNFITALGPGQPLDRSRRAYFEPRLGADFSHVRVHTGPKAEESAKSISAVAYTVGKDVVFGAGQYQPGTVQGNWLLAHELTHVVQQGAGPLQIRRQVGGASACGAWSFPYSIKQGDTGSSIATAHGITLACLQSRNPGISWTNLRIGQSINIPSSSCSVTVPSGQDEQMLAGGIFAEAVQDRLTNDEREAIASTFVNRVDHVTQLCNGGLRCPSLRTSAARARQCSQDSTNFGTTLGSAISTGSAAHGGTQWNKVMNGNSMRTSRDICSRIQPGELAPLLRAIAAANAMVGRVGSHHYVAFNQAANQPPSPRMERAASIGSHTFYRFRSGRECG